ncbi:MAG: hypothetical protein EOP48_31945, partial [Sphingobacteriales bacterium]
MRQYDIYVKSLRAFFADDSKAPEIAIWREKIVTVHSCANAYMFRQDQRSGNFYWRGKRTIGLADNTSIVIYKAEGDIKVLNFDDGTKFDFLAFLNNITGFNNYGILAKFDYNEMNLFLELLEVHYAQKVNIILFSALFSSTEALFFSSSLYINLALLAAFM